MRAVKSQGRGYRFYKALLTCETAMPGTTARPRGRQHHEGGGVSGGAATVLFESVSERIPRACREVSERMMFKFPSLGIENSSELAPESFNSPAASGDEKGDTELND